MHLFLKYTIMSYPEPNVASQPVNESNMEDVQCNSVQCNLNRLFRTYVPSFVAEKVDQLHDKRVALDAAVKEKINKVFSVCERIVEHYIPDESFERPEMDENTDVFTRMSSFSRELSTRICDKFLPFVTTEKEKLQKPFEPIKVRPLVESIKKPLSKVKETVEPVFTPFSPITTPLISLILLVFSTFYLFWRTILIDPIVYLYSLYKKYSTQVKNDFVADADGNYPIVGKATTAYNYVMDEIYPIFVDSEGKVTLEKFQSLCKTKGVEYQKLLKEKVTEENLRALLTKTEDGVKAAMAPVKENEKLAKEYYEELVKLFSDDEGHFTTEKLNGMVGESGSQLKAIITKGMKVISDTTSEKVETVKNEVVSRWNGVKTNAVSLVSVGMGFLLFFPTISFLLTVFVLSLFVDIDAVAPSPTMKKILSAIDTMEVSKQTEGSVTEVTVKYDDSKFSANEDDEL